MPEEPATAEELALENERLRTQIAELNRRRTFGLVWEPQSEERIEKEMRDKLPVLRHMSSLDVKGSRPDDDRPHILIEGDNLHALTVLQATHKVAIDAILIDPPYNTGKEFIYNDRLVKREDAWRHSAWLSFMDKRLRLARNLLKESGVLFVHIDDNEQAHLRLLCDQILGESNFIGMASWQSFDTTKNNAKLLSKNAEYVLMYARDIERVSFRGVLKGERQRATYSNPDNDPRGDYLATPLHVVATPDKPDRRRPRTFSNGQTWAPGPGQAWRFTEESLARLEGESRLKLDPAGRGTPQRKSYWSEGSERMPLHTFWKYEDFGSTRNSNKELGDLIGKGRFSFPKPVKLPMVLLEATMPKDAIILDFFAGSGTTGHAVAALNALDGGKRQAILITNNESNICRGVTRTRMKAVLTGDWADGKPHVSLPGSLLFYTTDLLAKSRNRDALRIRTAKALTDLLAVKENTFTVSVASDEYVLLSSSSKKVLVWTNLFDDRNLSKAIAAASEDADVERVLYAASAGLFGVDQALLNLAKDHSGWRIEALPEPFIRELEKAQRLAARRPR
jgi:adenine-specific DNA-methyltransferase